VQLKTSTISNGVLFDSDTGVITIQYSGYYYVYLSAGVQPLLPSRLTVLETVNSQPIVVVRRTSTVHSAVDLIGHGIVVELLAGYKLKVVAGANTAGYSSPTGLHTSFVGFLLDEYLSS
jgi:hypothetical protein